MAKEYDLFTQVNIAPDKLISEKPSELTDEQLIVACTDSDIGIALCLRIAASHAPQAVIGQGLAVYELSERASEVMAICQLELLRREGMIKVEEELSFDYGKMVSATSIISLKV